MSEIKITKESPDKWIAFDFVRYFYNKLIDKYGENTFEMNYERDCPIMKHIIDDFHKYSRTNMSVLHFIDWSITTYEEKKFPPPITVGFLKSWVFVFLGVPREPKKPRRPARKVVSLDKKQKSWAKEQKKKYEAT